MVYRRVQIAKASILLLEGLQAPILDCVQHASVRKLTLAAAKLLPYERPHCATRWGPSAVRRVGKQKKR